MNNKQKASALLQFMEDEWDGKAIINALNPLLKDEDLAALYDMLQKDGVIRESDDDAPGDGTPEEIQMRNALEYVREKMDYNEMQILQAEMNECYEMHLIPSENVMDCSPIIDLLEEYAQENDLPERWWEKYGEIDEWMAEL